MKIPGIELTCAIHKLVFPWEKTGMDSLPKSHCGRFVHPGFLLDESLDVVAPAKIQESCGLIIIIEFARFLILHELRCRGFGRAGAAQPLILGRRFGSLFLAAGDSIRGLAAEKK